MEDKDSIYFVMYSKKLKVQNCTMQELYLYKFNCIYGQELENIYER